MEPETKWSGKKEMMWKERAFIKRHNPYTNTIIDKHSKYKYNSANTHLGL